MLLFSSAGVEYWLIVSHIISHRLAGKRRARIPVSHAALFGSRVAVCYYSMRLVLWTRFFCVTRVYGVLERLIHAKIKYD
jgi:hypothetical protein